MLNYSVAELRGFKKLILHRLVFFMPTAPHLGMQVQRYKIVVALATFKVEIRVKKC